MKLKTIISYVWDKWVFYEYMLLGLFVYLFTVPTMLIFHWTPTYFKTPYYNQILVWILVVELILSMILSSKLVKYLRWK